ncbi:MAG: GNAT family N-acetyltransferase [Azospirillaceae bacterium]
MADGNDGFPDGDGGGVLSARLVRSIDQVPAADWDRLAGTSNPFVCHGFLSALEESGSVDAEAGWLPQHLLLEDEAGSLIGAVPLYVKGHSYGEYVFDHGWADAYERAGGQYYPKLQSAVPFTPVTGPRLLAGDGPGAPIVQRALIQALEQVAGQTQLSSLHVTFPTEQEWRAMTEAGWLGRYGQQYHWRNRDYGSFDDFLADLASRKRKNIRKEREKVRESGVVCEALTGEALTEDVWDDFYRFYMDTGSRKWGVPYLTRSFFSLLGERLADRTVLIMASHEGRRVAGALNLVGDEAIFGRNWGCDAHFRFLHFEACYYQAIDYAIAHGLKTVEAGAQGQHKVQRGYLPVRTYSAHWIRDPNFREAIERFLAREGQMVDWEIQEITDAGPFKKDG